MHDKGKVELSARGSSSAGHPLPRAGGDIHARRRMFSDDTVIIAGVCAAFRWRVTFGCSSSPISEPTPQLPTRGTARCRDVGRPCGALFVVEARRGPARIAHRRRWRRDINIAQTPGTTLGLRSVTLEATPGTGAPRRCAHLAQDGKARMHRVGVNVVRITCPHAQACFIRKSHATRADIGDDPGAKTSGLTLAIDGRVVWMAELHHRSASITKRMTAREQCRSTRRCRRKRNAGRGPKEARWHHRCKKAGWLPPSVYHRVQSLRRWIRWLAKFCEPMVEKVTVHVEVNAFDIHKAMNPDVHGTAYQRGPLWRANLRGYVLTRDKSKCVYCGSKNTLELDHVVAESSGGSDRHWNRVAACRECNQSKDNALIETWLAEGAPPKIARRRGSILRYVENVTKGRVKMSAMAAATVVGPCLVKKLRSEGFTVETSSGADTAAWRRIAGRREITCQRRGVHRRQEPALRLALRAISHSQNDRTRQAARREPQSPRHAATTQRRRTLRCLQTDTTPWFQGW